tara:strand:+ start:3862 stop:4929 length:1068 start_codon:yes stop_codon:yes gene_type:complete
MKIFKSLFKKKIRTVFLEGKQLDFPVEPGSTILESALRNGINFPHNCTVGTCGSCKCRLLEGKISAHSEFGYTLSSQEISSGYILACQSTPRQEKTIISVELDETTPSNLSSFTGRIIENKLLTHDIAKVTIKLSQPLKFIAGQYANIKAQSLARERNYSFASAPEDAGVSDVIFYIRKVDGGGFTERLFSGNMQNEILDLTGPHGNFHLRDSVSPMLCIAGGSGLAPIFSILKDAINNNVNRPCALLVGARTQKDLYELDVIKEISDKWNGDFLFLPVLSHEPKESTWDGARGLVTEFILDAFPNIENENAEAYMCGPPGMIDAGIATLTENGVQLSSIHYDKFTDQSHSAKMS